MAKRVGKALRDFAQLKRKKGERVGERKCGSITQVTIGKTTGLF